MQMTCSAPSRSASAAAELPARVQLACCCKALQLILAITYGWLKPAEGIPVLLVVQTEIHLRTQLMHVHMPQTSAR
jgi:hypothetical protein